MHFAKDWLKQLHWGFLMQFWGHYRDLTWQLYSYVTLNLVKAQRGQKKRESVERSGRNGSLLVPISLAANEHYFRLRTCQSQKPCFAKVMSNFHAPVWRKFDLKKTKSACLYTCVTVQIRNNKPHNETPTGESWVVSSISPEKLTTSVRKKWRLSVKCSQLFIMCSHKKKKRGAWAFEQQQAKNKSGKHEGKAGECDVMLSVIHAFTPCSWEKGGEGKKGRKAALFHSELIFLDFKTLHFCGQLIPSAPRCWGSLIRKGAQTHQRACTQ